MAKKRKSLPRRLVEFCSLFEAELLVELMLRFWRHPFADDAQYRTHLLSSAMEVLKESDAGKRFIEDLPPDQMNFVTAVWYVEWISITDKSEDPTNERQTWLETIRRSLPSCFCDQEMLNHGLE
jgi:hypothetical protein